MDIDQPDQLQKKANDDMRKLEAIREQKKIEFDQSIDDVFWVAGALSVAGLLCIVFTLFTAAMIAYIILASVAAAVGVVFRCLQRFHKRQPRDRK